MWDGGMGIKRHMNVSQVPGKGIFYPAYRILN